MGQHQDRLRAAIESAPSGLLMVDQDGRIILVNREIERLFGYAREDLLGREVEMLVPKRYRGNHSSFRDGFEGRPSVRAMGAGRDLYGLREDGSEVPIEIGLTPVPTAEGMSVLCAIVDITERKRAEDRFRAAVESSPAGMLMVDTHGTILMINREIERLFGYERSELVGQSIENLVPAAVRDQHANYRTGFIGHAAARPMGAGRDLHGVRKDGSEVPVEIGLNPIGLDEGLVILASVVDISERQAAEKQRRELEERLLRAQRLEALGTLAGSVAHDFNNLLGVILAYADLAVHSAEESSLRADIWEIIEAAGRGRDVVAAIRRFGRQEELALTATDLGALVQDAVPLLRPMLGATVIETKIDEDLPRCQVDSTSVIQVLMNLCKNAADAQESAEHQVVRIVVDLIDVGEALARQNPPMTPGRYLRIVVRDQGHGVPAELLERVFEPFFTTKSSSRGTGLGLAMVRRIVRENRGFILLDSEVGKGTSVSCLFPEAPANADGQAQVKPARPRGHGEHLLLVDDEVALLKGTQRRLERLGYEVSAHSSALDALAAFRDDPQAFRVVILDRTMPELGGAPLARELRAIRPGMPIILVTGFAGQLDPDAASVFDEVLDKPLDLALLTQTLQRLLAAG